MVQRKRSIKIKTSRDFLLVLYILDGSSTSFKILEQVQISLKSINDSAKCQSIKANLKKSNAKEYKN